VTDEDTPVLSKPCPVYELQEVDKNGIRRGGPNLKICPKLLSLSLHLILLSANISFSRYSWERTWCIDAKWTRKMSSKSKEEQYRCATQSGIKSFES
jgi:hypothetical protein